MIEVSKMELAAGLEPAFAESKSAVLPIRRRQNNLALLTLHNLILWEEGLPTLISPCWVIFRLDVFEQEFLNSHRITSVASTKSEGRNEHKVRNGKVSDSCDSCPACEDVVHIGEEPAVKVA